VASGTGLARRLGVALDEGAETTLQRGSDAVQIADAARAGDALAQELFRTAGAGVGRGIASAAALLDLELVVILAEARAARVGSTGYASCWRKCSIGSADFTGCAWYTPSWAVARSSTGGSPWRLTCFDGERQTAEAANREPRTRPQTANRERRTATRPSSKRQTAGSREP
jgi:predicted NBD/HSP70 family sugar kinase